MCTVLIRFPAIFSVARWLFSCCPRCPEDPMRHRRLNLVVPPGSHGESLADLLLTAALLRQSVQSWSTSHQPLSSCLPLAVISFNTLSSTVVVFSPWPARVMSKQDDATRSLTETPLAATDQPAPTHLGLLVCMSSVPCFICTSVVTHEPRVVCCTVHKQARSLLTCSSESKQRPCVRTHQQVNFPSCTAAEAFANGKIYLHIYFLVSTSNPSLFTHLNSVLVQSCRVALVMTWSAC
jgi:hypothetical protein